MNLYELNDAINALEIDDYIDIETGEIKEDEFNQALEALKIEKAEKEENIALLIKNLSADAEAYKREKMTFATRQKAAENKIEFLKGYLQYSLKGEKIKTSRVSVSYRRSEVVEVDDILSVPPEYMRYKDPEVDKNMVKEAFKNGEVVDGCRLVEKQNVVIK